MADGRSLRRAQNAYKTLCAMLDERSWNYDREEDKLKILCGAQGEDLPIAIDITVYPDLELVTLLSHMPFDVPEDRRTAVSLAVSLINDSIVDGDFDYDFLTGTIVFRLTSSILESLIGKEMFEYMLDVSCATVEEYNDKLLKVAEEDMSLEEIAKLIKGDE
ncbi:MAG: YbjN domain-containing protein [Clostridia bacterium]|nr:YbjN domain-containing protein [Clostridia bacterium]